MSDVLSPAIRRLCECDFLASTIYYLFQAEGFDFLAAKEAAVG
jgi:hypothetical protein